MSSGSVRVAGIDCGTNSIRLLVADIGPDFVELDRRMQIIRLGEGVDRTGSLSAAALQRAFAACQEYADLIEEFGAQRVRFVATSASRDASNAHEFADGVQRILGVTPEVVTGEEEARLSFAGAMTGSGLPSPALVFDIGGGSTEFIRGAQEPEVAVSVDMGCVRFTERFASNDPMTPAELAAIRTEVDRLLDQVEQSVPLRGAASLVGLAGTVTTVAGLAAGLTEYDSERIHLSTASAAAVEQVMTDLVGMSAAERAGLGIMHPGRADVIAAGAVILDQIVKRSGANEVTASEHDILDGIAWSLAATV